MTHTDTAVIEASTQLFFDRDAFKLKKEAKLIRDVVNLSLERLIVTEDLSDGKKSFSTSAVGTWLSNEILK